MGMWVVHCPKRCRPLDQVILTACLPGLRDRLRQIVGKSAMANMQWIKISFKLEYQYPSSFTLWKLKPSRGYLPWSFCRTWVRIVDSDSNIVHGGLLSKYVTPCGRLIVILVMLEANCGKKSFEYEVIFFYLKA